MPTTVTQVLIVDDSVIARRFIAKAIEGQRDMALHGCAANGQMALKMIARRRPDLVVLDLEMPELNGIETLLMLRKLHPDLPVIVFSALSERGAALTIEALQLGARDYLLKPAGMGSADEALDYIRRELLERVRALLGTPAVKPRAALKSSRVVQAQPVAAVGIAASTGGPLALNHVLERMPGDYPVPVFVVQHLPASFIEAFVSRLDARIDLQVGVAEAGVRPVPGQVWFAPGDTHLVVEREGPSMVLRLDDGPPRRSCRPSADVLFESLARTCGAATLALVMTGMGCDGRDGATEIHRRGGRVMAQGRSSCVVWSMPGAIVKAGIADEIVELDQIPERLAVAVAR